MVRKNPPAEGTLSIFVERPWERTAHSKGKIFAGSSSFSHKDASRILREMGIAHENEKVTRANCLGVMGYFEYVLLGSVYCFCF